MSPARARIAAALALLVALAGCASPVPPTITPASPTAAPSPTTAPGPTASPAPGDPDQPAEPTAPGRPVAGPHEPLTDEDLHDLGVRMTGVLASGTVEDWAALLDLDEDGQAQQAAWFETVQAVPMDVREMHPTRVLQPGRPAEGVGAEVEFAFRHQVTGADLTAAVQRYRFTVSRDDAGAPLVTAVDGVAGMAHAYPQLWDLGPAVVRVGDHVIVIGHQDSAQVVDRLLPSLDSAAASVFELLPVDGVGRMVLALGTTEDLGTLFGFGEVSSWAGFAVPVPGNEAVQRRDGGLTQVPMTQSRPVRLVIDESYAYDEWDFYGDDDSGGLPVMRHEGTHLAMTLRDPQAWPAPWVSEGFAGWVEVTGSELVRLDHWAWYDVLAQGEPPTALPTSSERRFFDEDQVNRNYAESAVVFLYMEDRWGHQLTLETGIALHAEPRSADRIGAVLTEHLGVSYEEFEAGFVQWATAQLD